MIYPRRIVLCVIVATLVAIFSVPTYAQEGDSIVPAYELPADHYPHVSDDIADPNQFIEWYYFTGVMTDQDGRLWGYQVTLFIALFDGVPGYLYDVAVSDAENQQFWHYRGIATDPTTDNTNGLLFDDGIFRLAYHVDADSWSYRFKANTETVDGSNAADITLVGTLATDSVDYFSQVPENSVAPLGSCATDITTLEGYTYYYSNPKLVSTITLRIGEDTYALGGDTWFDHQWGNFAHCYLAWNWFSFRLDDGSSIMIFQYFEADGAPYSLGATYRSSDGDVDYWTEVDGLVLTPLRTWENPRNGLVVPLDWQLITPAGEFYMTPLFDDQMPVTNDFTPPYWEGLVSVRDGGPNGDELGISYFEGVPLVR